MKQTFTPLGFEKIFNVKKIITIFYMEFSKNFCYDGEKHDFWEMVYIDKGQVLCTADKSRFILKSGEMIFHKPNEFHNLTGDKSSAPNVSIMTFECKSRAMKRLEGKIFRLDKEQKDLLSLMFEEGLSCFKLVDEHNPLLQKLKKIDNAPLGSSQVTKNLLEVFLVKMCRSTDTIAKQMHRSYIINSDDVPYSIRDILDCLYENVYGKISVGDIARRVGKSESTVKQLFFHYRPGGIINYYNSLKINEAKKLIREQNYNMTQISDILGFDNPQYFSKCFKRQTRMTPGEYKKSIIK